MLTGVDRAAFAVAFATKLQQATVDVGWSRVATFTAALEVAGTIDRRQLYWTARTTLVGRPGDLVAFDAVFEAVFGHAVLGADPHARRSGFDADDTSVTGDAWARMPAGHDDLHGSGDGLPWATLPRSTRSAVPLASALAVPERLPTALAGLVDVPFDRLDDDDLEALAARFAAVASRWPTRRRHRVHPTRGGRTVLLRPTLARARRTGFEPLQLVHGGPRRRARRLVLVADVSRSMQPHVVAHLHLLRAASVSVDAEVFAVATSWRRLTAVLRHRSAAEAVQLATERVTDRFGGTRLAGTLGELLRSRHGDLFRGAVVVILSDGWDSEPPEALAAVLARLRRRAHGVVWVNPRSGVPGWEPLVGSMSAALPFCDRVLPGHTVHALLDVVDALAELDRRPPLNSPPLNSPPLNSPPLNSRASRAPRDGTARS